MATTTTTTIPLIRSGLPACDKLNPCNTKKGAYFTEIGRSAGKVDKVLKVSICIFALISIVMVSAKGKSPVAHNFHVIAEKLGTVRMGCAVFGLANFMAKVKDSGVKAVQAKVPKERAYHTSTTFSGAADVARTFAIVNGWVKEVLPESSSQFLSDAFPVITLVRHTAKLIDVGFAYSAKKGELFEEKTELKTVLSEDSEKSVTTKQVTIWSESNFIIAISIMAIAIEVFLSAAKVGRMSLGLYGGPILALGASGISLYVDFAKQGRDELT